MHPQLAPHPRLPAETRLWAALQSASGGAWRGCVYDVDRIVQLLEAGHRAIGEGRASDPPGMAPEIERNDPSPRAYEFGRQIFGEEEAPLSLTPEQRARERDRRAQLEAAGGWFRTSRPCTSTRGAAWPFGSFR